MSPPLLVAACSWPQSQPEPTPEPPDHVVLIVVDTLRADHLGAYGYPKPTSPLLDAWAAEGVVFEQAMATSSWTRPSMGTMFTGHYGRSLGLYVEEEDSLPPSADTLAEQLKGAGYTTLGVTSNPNVNAYYGFDQGYDAYRDSTVVFRRMPAEEGHVHRGDGNDLLDAAAVTDRTVELMSERPLDGPVFLSVHYIDPHLPNRPPAEHAEAVGSTGDRVGDYDAEIHYVDAEIARLRKALAAHGITDKNTWFVLTSDHGEGLEDHGELPAGSLHGNHLYDSVIHIPLVVWHPSVQAGTRRPELVSLADIFPTLLDAAGLSPGDVPGRSLVPAMTGRGPLQTRPAFSETDWRFNDKVAIRTLEHTVVRNDDVMAWHADPDSRPELKTRLHPLFEDIAPWEIYVRGAPQRPLEMSKNEHTMRLVEHIDLKEQLDGWIDEHPRADSTPAGSEGLSDDVSKQLEALGYVSD